MYIEVELYLLFLPGYEISSRLISAHHNGNWYGRLQKHWFIWTELIFWEQHWHRSPSVTEWTYHIATAWVKEKNHVFLDDVIISICRLDLQKEWRWIPNWRDQRISYAFQSDAKLHYSTLSGFWFVTSGGTRWRDTRWKHTCLMHRRHDVL